VLSIYRYRILHLFRFFIFVISECFCFAFCQIIYQFIATNYSCNSYRSDNLVQGNSVREEGNRQILERSSSSTHNLLLLVWCLTKRVFSINPIIYSKSRRKKPKIFILFEQHLSGKSSSKYGRTNSSISNFNKILFL